MHIVFFLLILASASAQAPGVWLYGVPNSNIGTSVGTITDLDGDGDADIFVGGPTTGETYLVFVNLSETVSSLNLSQLSNPNDSRSLPGYGVILRGAGDTGNSVSSAGDFNGDGFNDIIIGAPRASPNNITFAGTTYVIFGQSFISPLPNVIDLRHLDGTLGFQISGYIMGEEAGTVSGLDDIDGDGYDDIIIGAPLGSPNGENSGRVYVIYGYPGPFPEVFNLSSINGSNGFVINGMSPGEQAGYAVGRAGDVNADGAPDILIGAPFAIVNNTPFCGRVYLLWGNTTRSPPVVELSDLPNTTAGTIFNGNTGDYVGFGGVAALGDFNGDGVDDFIMGAPHSGPSGTGQAYVIFGRPYDSQRPFNHTVTLKNLRGTTGFSLVGTVVGGTAGFVGPGGDINGDGFSDIIVGAPLVSPQGISKAGQIYILFGHNDSGNPFPPSLKLTSIPANSGFTINGADANSQSGFSVSTSGDLDGDGFSDILIGAPSVAPSSGEAFVIFGRNTTANPYRNPFPLNLLNACWGYPLEIGSNFIVNQSCAPPVPSGKSCNLTCAPGYVAVGNPYLSTTCSSEGIGRYLPLVGSCQAATCSPLSLPTGVNTSNLTSNCLGGTATTGTECILNCLDGYSRVGTSICTGMSYNVSIWVSNQTCIPANCSTLTLPAGANANSLPRKCITDKGTGTTCPFTCNMGYINNGGITVCVGTGPGASAWQSNQSCIPANCAGITLPVGAINADAICTNGLARTGDQCRFSCANGYNWTGLTTCVGVNATASAFVSNQNCIPASCPALVLPSGANQTSISSKCLARASYPGDVCDFECLPGYSESGVSVCQGVNPGVSGWRTNQTCVAAQCPSFQFPLGADTTSVTGCANATTGTHCLFPCLPGWIHSGGSSCVGVGPSLSDWVSNQTCIRAPCAGITLPAGAITPTNSCIDGSAVTGDSCEWSCDNGYYHSGVTFCEPFGRGTSAFGGNQTCIPASCGVFRLPAGVDTTTVQPICTNGLATTGSSCNFGCRAGYSHSGVTLCLGTGPGQAQFFSNQTCESAYCAPITIPPGAIHVRGHCTDGQAVIGDTCQFDCATGYVHSGITVCASTGLLTAAFFNTQQCTDYDACGAVQTPCGSHADCIDLPPPLMNYTCQCESGYELSSNGTCVDIPACLFFPCAQQNEVCSEIQGGDNSTNGRVCECAEGYTQANDTDLCEDIPACFFFPCDVHATCFEMLGGPNSTAGRKCECNSNYYGNGEAGYCFVIETCDDGVQDNGETDVDCGGIRCSPCAVGKKCVSDSDCESKSCDDLRCIASGSTSLTWLSQVLLALIAAIVTLFLVFLTLRWMHLKGRLPCLRRTIIFNEEMELPQIEGDGQAVAADPVMALPVEAPEQRPPSANARLPEEAQFLNQNPDQINPLDDNPNETAPPEAVAVLFHDGNGSRGDRDPEIEPVEGQPGSQS